MSQGKQHRKALYADLQESPLVQAVDKAKTDAERYAAIRTLYATCKAGKIQASPLYTKETIPIGSPMEKWLREFHNHSKIPAELAFWVPFQLLGHFLMYRGAKIDMEPSKQGVALKHLYTNTYMLHAGDAASGKGLVEDLTWEALGSVNCPKVGRIGSQEAFLQCLENHDGRALLQVLDEWATVWEQLKANPSQGDTLTTYLRAYRQQPCELAYLKKTYACKKPLLTVCAFVQPARLFDVLEPKDYSNGFVRRHIIVFSPPVKLTMADQHKYDPQIVAEALRKSGVVDLWKKHVENTPVHETYTFDVAATEHIRWHILKVGIDLGLEHGYITTALYTARKFALIYHYLLGEPGTIICRKAAEYAVALTRLTLHDLQYLMDEGRRSALSNLIEEAVQLRIDLETGKKKGKWEPRKLQQNIHIADVATARFVFEVVSGVNIRDLIEQPTEENMVTFPGEDIAQAEGDSVLSARAVEEEAHFVQSR